MKTRTTRTATARRAAPAGAALIALGILLAGCTGGGQAAPRPTPTSSSTADVSDSALGSALDKLVFQGDQKKEPADESCLVDAARGAKLSAAALAYIVKTDGDDYGSVAKGLRSVSTSDSELLLSPQLREAFDACVTASVLPDGGKSDGPQKYTAPTSTPAAPEEKDPNLKPTYPILDNEQITTTTQLTQGLVAMFSSYALDQDQKQTYADAGECMAKAVLDAGFSQETLRFLAGGAPIGSGSVSDYLPVKDDKTIWESREFTTALVDCTMNAEPAATDAPRRPVRNIGPHELTNPDDERRPDAPLHRVFSLFLDHASGPPRQGPGGTGPPREHAGTGQARTECSSRPYGHSKSEAMTTATSRRKALRYRIERRPEEPRRSTEWTGKADA